MPIPPRCCCWTTRAVSWSPLRPAAWRRRSARGCGSRLAGVSRAASPAERRPVILERVEHGLVLNPLLLQQGHPPKAGGRAAGGAAAAVLGVLHAGTLRTGCSPPTMPRCSNWPLTGRRKPCSRCGHARIMPPRSPCRRSLVSSALPALAAVEVAARYVPGFGHVGGDWYDVFVLPSGKLGLVVGDVAGSGACRRRQPWAASAAPCARTRWSSPARLTCWPWTARMQYFEETPIMATVCYAGARPGLRAAGHLIGGPSPAGQRRPRPAHCHRRDRRGHPERLLLAFRPPGHDADAGARRGALLGHRRAGGTPVRAHR